VTADGHHSHRLFAKQRQSSQLAARLSDKVMSTDHLSIAHDILLTAPPGQFDAILSDLRILVPDFPESFVKEARRAYGRETGASLLDGSAVSPAAGGDNANALRSRLDEYLRLHYSSEGVSSSHSVAARASAGPRGSDLIATTYAERVSDKNCVGGSWRCEYKVQVLSERQATVGGTVRVRAHCYEGGNCQLDSEKRLAPVTVTATKDKIWADAVVDQMDQWEAEDVQGSLAEVYAGMGDGMLKSLRRVIPVTRTRMDWNAAGHRLIQTLNMSKK